jgi:hypothetical protein
VVQVFEAAVLFVEQFYDFFGSAPVRDVGASCLKPQPFATRNFPTSIAPNSTLCDSLLSWECSLSTLIIYSAFADRYVEQPARNFVGSFQNPNR